MNAQEWRLTDADAQAIVEAFDRRTHGEGAADSLASQIADAQARKIADWLETRALERYNGKGANSVGRMALMMAALRIKTEVPKQRGVISQS